MHYLPNLCRLSFVFYPSFLFSTNIFFKVDRTLKFDMTLLNTFEACEVVVVVVVLNLLGGFREFYVFGSPKKIFKFLTIKLKFSASSLLLELSLYSSFEELTFNAIPFLSHSISSA